MPEVAERKGLIIVCAYEGHPGVLKYFSDHRGNENLRPVIGRNIMPDLNHSGILLLDLFANDKPFIKTYIMIYNEKLMSRSILLQ